MYRPLVTVFCILLLIYPHTLNASRFRTIYVGIIGKLGDDHRQYDRKFWSVESDGNVIMEPVFQSVSSYGYVETSRAICNLLKIGVHVIVSTVPANLHNLMKSYSKRFRIPMISIQNPMDNDVAYLMPETTQAIADLLNEHQWNTFLYIYDDDSGPVRLEALMKASGNRLKVKAMLKMTRANEIRYLFSRPTEASPKVVLMATAEKLLDELLENPPIGEYHYVLVNPVVVPSSTPISNQGTFTVTKLSFGVSSDSKLYNNLENRWHTIQNQFLAIINSKSYFTQIPDSALLLRDVAKVLDQAYFRLMEESPYLDISSPGVNCYDDEFQNKEEYWPSISNHIKKVRIDSGLTGRIQFSQDGKRVGHTFNITEITPTESKKIGEWTEKTGLKITKVIKKDKPESAKLQKVIVATILSNSFLTLKDGYNGSRKEGYEGYAKDVIQTLAEALGWNYELHLAKDGKIGDKLRNGMWDGVLGEVIRQEADMAIAPFDLDELVNATEFDFSKPILSSGLTILLKKADAALHGTVGLNPLWILDVWSYEVWLILVVAYVVVSGANYVASRFTGEPDRIRSLDTKLSDRLSPCSSFWFVLGSLTFRGTGIYPRSITHRLLSLMWWAFSLGLFACYVASLASALFRSRTSTETPIYPAKSEEFLQKFIEQGNPKIGIWKEENYFKNAKAGPPKDYANVLRTDLSLLVDSYEDGLDRIRRMDGDFAMVVDSVFGHYISGKPPCDLMVTTGYLVHKSYAIVFKKGSPLLKPVNKAILDMMTEEKLRRFYERWWYHNSSCADPHFNKLPGIYGTSLTLHEVSAAFYFLIIATSIACIVAAVEFMIHSKKTVEDK